MRQWLLHFRQVLQSVGAEVGRRRSQSPPAGDLRWSAGSPRSAVAASPACDQRFAWGTVTANSGERRIYGCRDVLRALAVLKMKHSKSSAMPTLAELAWCRMTCRTLESVEQPLGSS